MSELFRVMGPVKPVRIVTPPYEPTRGEAQGTKPTKTKSTKKRRVSLSSERVEELTSAILSALVPRSINKLALDEPELAERLAGDGVELTADELGIVIDKLVADGRVTLHPRYGYFLHDPMLRRIRSRSNRLI